MWMICLRASVEQFVWMIILLLHWKSKLWSKNCSSWRFPNIVDNCMILWEKYNVRITFTEVINSSVIYYILVIQMIWTHMLMICIGTSKNRRIDFFNFEFFYFFFLLKLIHLHCRACVVTKNMIQKLCVDMCTNLCLMKASNGKSDPTAIKMNGLNIQLWLIFLYFGP